MKEGNAATTSSMKVQGSESGNPFGGKGGYKFWVLAAILLLAFWSVFTGSVTLKWSASNLSRFPEDVDFPSYDDLDVLVGLSLLFLSFSFFFLFSLLGGGLMGAGQHLAGGRGESETGKVYVGLVHSHRHYTLATFLGGGF